MSKENRPLSGPEVEFFRQPLAPTHRQYEALRAYFLDGLPAATVAQRFGYSRSAFQSLCRDFRQGRLQFFALTKPGPKRAPKREAARARVIELRKRNYSIYEIQTQLAGEDLPLSHTVIHQILQAEGFAKLPRRAEQERPCRARPEPVEMADVRALEWSAWERVETQAGGLFIFIPTLVAWGFEHWIKQAQLPGSSMIPALNTVLAMLALKLTGHERLSHVMDSCGDAGFALFAALNVLPKTTALSTYSYRVTRAMMVALLQSYHQAVRQAGLVQGECFNLDFHPIPHRGEEAVLEKHYVSKRSRRERAILVFLAQDSDTQVLCYANATVTKAGHAAEILRFVEFWTAQQGRPPPCLIFDSQLTSYRQLGVLHERGIRFITLRRRGSALLQHLAALPRSAWKPLRLAGMSRRCRQVRYIESQVSLRGLEIGLRQLAVDGLGHDEPTLFITNDQASKPATLIERYAHRMLVENAIAANVDFFHLDALSSAIALQVDLDVMLTLIANALYRHLAKSLTGFETAQPKQLFRRFLNTPARVCVTDTTVQVRLQRRAHHPVLLNSGLLNNAPQVPWWENRQLLLEIA
jgi:hypothetical protein